jgi:hypothetical protein
MKGMLDLLERAGLVQRVGGAEDVSAGLPAAEHSPDAIAAAVPPAPRAVPAPATPAPAAQDSTGLSLEQVFAAAGVPVCAYPAERLLRLLDGLKAMDEPMRRQTIQAIDAADDSWTIEDPMRDAAAKVASIERHASTIRAGVAQAEQETQARLRELAQRQESSVTEIRRQIADLEGLLAREIARGAQENAALEAALVAQRESANRELAELSRAAAAFATLITQFGGHAPR